MRVAEKEETVGTRELMNVRETAREIGVHENTIRNWESRGILRAVRLPGSGFRRFSLAEVQRLRDEMMNQLAPAVEGPSIELNRRPTGNFSFSDESENVDASHDTLRADGTRAAAA